MEELAPDDPLFSDDWITEVSVAVDECSSEVNNEYLISRENDPPSDVMSQGW